MPTIDASWVAIIAGIVGVIVALLSRRWAGSDARGAAIRLAAQQYREALARGDAEGAMLAKRRYAYLRSGGALYLAVCFLLACSGCSHVSPAIVLSEHASFPSVGSTIPPLPEGENRWLLLSVPTGVEMMLPTDFPIAELRTPK